MEYLGPRHELVEEDRGSVNAAASNVHSDVPEYSLDYDDDKYGGYECDDDNDEFGCDGEGKFLYWPVQFGILVIYCW